MGPNEIAPCVASKRLAPGESFDLKESLSPDGGGLRPSLQISLHGGRHFFGAYRAVSRCPQDMTMSCPEIRLLGSQDCRNADFVVNGNRDFKRDGFGSCLIFNDDGVKTVKRRSERQGTSSIISGMGSSDGLQLILKPHVWNQKNRYLATGFRLQIYSPGAEYETIFGKEYEVNLGTISHVTPKKLVLQRLPPDEGGDCAPASYLEKRFDLNMFNLKTKYEYTNQGLGRFAYTDSSRFRKTIWLLVFITASCYMTHGIIGVFTAFMSGAVTTSTQRDGFGSCLIFNDDGVKTVKRLSERQGTSSIISGMGSSDGLQLILKPHVWNQKNRYLATGFRLQIHSPGAEYETIFGKEYEVNLGTISHVTPKKLVLQRLPPDEGGDCAPASYLEKRFDLNMFNLKTKYEYTNQVRKAP
ncbi:unnamed protein product [Darwinula stevensoni]|uniref:Uncharacterized protein n=1 Tax=Darwinula stevensoni TaxID=69355 RepID=A0A7R9A3G2_9CRUS|nr:unnamed protein product [Darwinula stevensoni]CAG0890626.1 unnamed protein product [Darwinula stevensoni]